MPDYECPVCKGSGKLELPRAVDWKKEAVKVLHSNGFGVRQIQRLLCYQSPQSISFILSKK